MQDTTLWSPQSWIWNRSKSIRPTTAYGRSKNPSGSQKSYLDARPIYVHKKKQSMGIFNLLP